MQGATTRWRIGAGLAAIALVLPACSTPGEDDGGETEAGTEEITAPVSDEEVHDLGDVTLRVLADAGEEATLDVAIPMFEERYPNVTVEPIVRSYDDLVRTAVNTMAGEQPPDVAQGAQGFAVDGALVEAGLVRPLDDIAEAYGWTERYGEASLSEFRWSDDGSEFGTGTLYGVAPVVSLVGVYANAAKLADLGLSQPASLAEFEDALSASEQAGEVPIMFGNAERYPGLHLYGVVQGQYAEAQDVRDWIQGREGASFDTDANRQTIDKLAEWAAAGYIADGANGVSADDAIARFARGEGLFYVGGNWLMPGLTGAAGDDAGDFSFFAMPPGETGSHAASGSMGLGWHISSSTEVLPAAVAWIAMLHEAEFAQQLADLDRLPAVTDGLEASTPLVADAFEMAQNLLGDGGTTLSFDWASPSMMDTMGGAVQELLDARTTADVFIETVQDDWQAFVEEREQG